MFPHGNLEEDSGRGILAYSAARQLREQAKRDWVRGAMNRVFTLVGYGRAIDQEQDFIRFFLCCVTILSVIMTASETLVRMHDARSTLCPELAADSASGNASIAVLESECHTRVSGVQWWWPSAEVPMHELLRVAFAVEVLFTVVAVIEYALRIWSSPVLFDSRFDISANRAALLSATHLKRWCKCYDMRWWCALRCSRWCGPWCSVRWFAPVSWNELVRPGAFVALSPPQTSLLIKSEAERLIAEGAGLGEYDESLGAGGPGIGVGDKAAGSSTTTRPIALPSRGVTSGRRRDSHLGPEARRALVAQITGVKDEDSDETGSESERNRGGSIGGGGGNNPSGRSEWVVVEAKEKASGSSLARLRGQEQVLHRGAAPSPVYRAVEMATAARIQEALQRAGDRTGGGGVTSARRAPGLVREGSRRRSTMPPKQGGALLGGDGAGGGAGAGGQGASGGRGGAVARGSRLQASTGSQEELTGEVREAAAAAAAGTGASSSSTTTTANPLLGRSASDGHREGTTGGSDDPWNEVPALPNGQPGRARSTSMEGREAAALRVVSKRPRTSLPRQSSGRWAMGRIMLEEEDADTSGRRRTTGPVSPSHRGGSPTPTGARGNRFSFGSASGADLEEEDSEAEAVAKQLSPLMDALLKRLPAGAVVASKDELDDGLPIALAAASAEAAAAPMSVNSPLPRQALIAAARRRRESQMLPQPGSGPAGGSDGSSHGSAESGGGWGGVPSGSPLAHPRGKDGGASGLEGGRHRPPMMSSVGRRRSSVRELVAQMRPQHAMRELQRRKLVRPSASPELAPIRWVEVTVPEGEAMGGVFGGMDAAAMLSEGGLTAQEMESFKRAAASSRVALLPRYTDIPPASWFWCRVHFALRWFEMLELLAIVPLLALAFSSLQGGREGPLTVFGPPDWLAPSIWRVVRMGRLLRLLRFAEGVEILQYAFARKRRDMVTAVLVCALTASVLAVALYIAEQEGPTGDKMKFFSIPEAGYFSVSLLTTVGFGDVTARSLAGRMISTIGALMGIGLFTLPGATLARGFQETTEAAERAQREGMDQLRVTLRRIALRQGFGRWVTGVRSKADEGALGEAGVLATNGGRALDPEAARAAKRRRLAGYLVQLCGGDVSVTLRTLAAARRVLSVEQERTSAHQS